MSFILALTLVRVNVEDHSQQSRWKMSKHFFEIYIPVDIVGGTLIGEVLASNYLQNTLSETLLKNIEAESSYVPFQDIIQ